MGCSPSNVDLLYFSTKHSFSAAFRRRLTHTVYPIGAPRVKMLLAENEGLERRPKSLCKTEKAG
jgi:hypothetical protein